MPCYSPLKGWRDKETNGIVFRPCGSSECMEVACGQCLGCRLDRSRVWALRIVHEASLCDSAVFVTLTYRDLYDADDDQLEGGFHVPHDWSLDKSHFRNFMKRLRKAFWHYDADGKKVYEKIRYFHCGEYGNVCRHSFRLDLQNCPYCTVGRPHYHAILFGCDFPDLVAYKGEGEDTRYTSPFLESIWKYGFVDVGNVNFESAAYVSRYILKKVTGPKADDHYMFIDEDGVCDWLEPEYCTMSRRPGIGKDWFDSFVTDVFPSDEVPVPDMANPRVIKKVPRYYEELFRREHPLRLEEIKALRKEFRAAHAHEYTPERLMDKYKVKKAQVSMLKRTV